MGKVFGVSAWRHLSYGNILVSLKSIRPNLAIRFPGPWTYAAICKLGLWCLATQVHILDCVFLLIKAGKSIAEAVRCSPGHAVLEHRDDVTLHNANAIFSCIVIRDYRTERELVR